MTSLVVLIIIREIEGQGESIPRWVCIAGWSPNIAVDSSKVQLVEVVITDQWTGVKEIGDRSFE